MEHSLQGKIAIVAGATRGAGRGIAWALGEAGAIVYCTGRSVRGNPSPYQRRETIEETAEMINTAGGAGIALRVDHTIESEVSDLVTRVMREQERLDILVNSIAGEDPLLGSWGPFWKADLSNADTALRQTLVSHIITAKHAAGAMVRQRSGLIVEVTEGDLLISGGSTMAQMVRLSQKALAGIWAAELKPHGVAAIAITPGFLRSERMLEHFGVNEANWRDAGAKDRNFLESESPLFVGRAVAALAVDPKTIERTGQLFSSWEVGRAYGLTDVDGRRPDWGALDVDYSRVPTSLLQAFGDALDIQSRWLKELCERTERQRETIARASSDAL